MGSQPKLRTQFMQDFIREFIGDPDTIKEPGYPDPWPDPSRKWPIEGQGPSEIAADYTTFVNVLLTVGYAKLARAQNGALAERVEQFLTRKEWPTAEPNILTPEYQYEDRGTVTLVEIAVILDRLLQAINHVTPARVPLSP
jgi:hypothetical protein